MGGAATVITSDEWRRRAPQREEGDVRSVRATREDRASPGLKQSKLPLHCGHADDLGGNEIDLYWYSTSINLHQVWDTNMIYSEEDDFYNESVDGLVSAINQNMTALVILFY
ncbi:hypothetical protein Dimus_028587 [Dionaea muscipula]